MIDQKHASLKCDLVTLLLKDEFERQVLSAIDFSKNMEEIDHIISQMLEQFFNEAEIIYKVYAQDYTIEDLNEKDFMIQKRNCLIRIAGLKLETFTLEQLRKATSIESIDGYICLW